MTVREARREIEYLEDTINAIHMLTKYDTENDNRVDKIVEAAGVGMFWKSIALHSINAMAAYKNILQEKIDNAQI